MPCERAPQYRGLDINIVGIRKKARTVGFLSAAGEGTVTLTDGDDLMLYGTYDFSASTVSAGTFAMEGVESFLIDSGTYPGAYLDVSGTSTNVMEAGLSPPRSMTSPTCVSVTVSNTRTPGPPQEESSTQR